MCYLATPLLRKVTAQWSISLATPEGMQKFITIVFSGMIRSFLIWRSLKSSPPLHTLLGNLIEILSQGQETLSSQDIQQGISQLINCLLDILPGVNARGFLPVEQR
jgi:hypothetical protein